MVSTNTGSGVAHSHRADDQAELDVEERYLRLWAYGTSPHGLGVPPERFWTLTTREFQALKHVHRDSLMRWAVERSMYANVNFLRRDSSGNVIDEPWTPEDFLGEGNRKERADKRFMSQMEAEAANIALLKITKGAPPTDDIPVWARG